MKITGGKIVSVSADKLEGKTFEGFEFNIQITDVKENGKTIEIHYSQDMKYKQDFARMTIKGVIAAEVDDKEKKRIFEEWKKNKQFPLDLVEDVLMAVNYGTTAVGTLLAFAINVNAPLNIPRTKIVPASQEQKAG